MEKAQTERLQTFDAMRGLCAVAVLFFHLDFVGKFAPSGYLAVDFFFLMSGVVIARSYKTRLEKELTVQAFIIERIVRLYPFYALGLAIGIARRIGQIATNHPNQMSWSDAGISAAFNLIMLPSPVTGELAPFNVPSWSLFFEFFINIIWACFLVKATSKALIIYVLFLTLALFVAVILNHSAASGWNWSEIHFGVIRSFFGFGLGVLIEKIISNRNSRDSYFSIIATLFLCILLILDVPSKFRALYDLCSILIFFPAVVICGSVFNPPTRYKRVSKALGEISYPLYLLHLGPLFSISYFARKYDINPIIWIPLFLLCICSASLFLARTYDPTARKYLKSIINRRFKKMCQSHSST